MADQNRLPVVQEKPKVFIISDISNEPDDAESLVRFLLYGNEFDTQGIVACTSCWMRDKVHPEDMVRIVKAYGPVVDNLNSHVHPDNQYPSAETLLGLIKSGPACYGKEALADGVDLSEGAALLIEKLDASDRPLWVLCWGGVNTLAQALHHVRRTRSEEDARHLRSKLRVYTISDQDDTGLWIRVTFPDIFYICSVHGWKEYGMATWVGISGDMLMKHMDNGGPDVTMISKEWLKDNIQSVGSLGKVYPTPSFIMEGDTPTFLYLIQNGLGSPEYPHWGSWGGRYILGDIGGAAKHYMDARDTVVGKNGSTFVTNQATVWRWRDAYQNDFAARMQWTLSKDRKQANHAPVISVNGSSPGPQPLFIDAEAGDELILDASGTYDPDGDELSFRWFQYKEPTTAQSEIHWPVVAGVIFEPSNESASVKVKIPPPEICAVNVLTGQALDKGQVLHLVLEVRDSGTPSMTAYKRVVVQVTNNCLKGGKSKVYDTITEAIGHSTGQDTTNS